MSAELEEDHTTDKLISTQSYANLPADVIEGPIFEQLREMDEPDDVEFSRSIVDNYFEQAESTFISMDKALEAKDLTELSTLGHFLKGSSAAVGVIKVRDSCECMQHYGKLRNADGSVELSEVDAIAKLTETLKEVKVQYEEAKKALEAYYEKHVGGEGGDGSDGGAES